MRGYRVEKGVETLTLEIKRKENLAEEAKRKGMLATYGTYKADIAYLQVRLKKLRTAPYGPGTLYK